MSQVTEINKENTASLIPLDDILMWDNRTSEEHYEGTNGGNNTQELLNKDEISQKQMLDVFNMIKLQGEQAWNDAKLSDGTDIKYVAVGEASIVLAQYKMDQSIENKLTKDEDIVKGSLDVTGAKTKQVFIVKYTTRTNSGERSSYQRLAVLGMEVIASSLVIKLLSQVLTKVFIAIVNKSLGVATITSVEAAMQELQATQGNNGLKFIGWTQGATRGARAFRFLGKTGLIVGITYLLEELYKKVISREYELHTYLLNLTKEDWTVKILHSYNIAGRNKESTSKEELELNKILKKGEYVIIPGVFAPATSENDQVVSFGKFLFSNDSKHLKGCGVLIEIRNKNQNTAIKSVLYKLEIPRIGNNKVNLIVNKKDGYKGEEVYNEPDKDSLCLKYEQGNIKLIHAYNSLQGQEDNKYIGFLTIVDTGEFPQYKSK